MKKRKKIIFGAAVIVVLAIAGIMLMSGGTEVETNRVTRGKINRSVVDSGVVQPVESWDIYAEQNARVESISLETGTQVKKGQLIMSLENKDLAVQIADAKARLAQSQLQAAGAQSSLEKLELALKQGREDLKRAEKLLEEGVITETELEGAQLTVKSYEKDLSEQKALLESARAGAAGLRETLTQLSDKKELLTVKSPAVGVILNLPVKQGELVMPGSLLVSISLPGELEVKADVLSDDLGEIKLGQNVSITAPVLGDKVLSGTVEKIYPQAEEKQSALGITQRRVPVIISLTESANLKPGYEVQIAIETIALSDVLVIPRESVRTVEGDKKEVMAVMDGKIEHRLIKTGASDADLVEILDGMKKGDIVIRDAGLDLKENQKVKIMP
ncbi:MAG: efflux RND transporter periplasmic adaptor subunit [Desulfitobacteriaceae bacterium]|nr:efflux RND transporter periplasmic adaptor subunit [Desulfitobacteriaceae bacterium]MDD4752982.1 efflux RND transporter periplasmic adaptor subunit [Desulfitobacteriaceae bacterium]